MYDMEIVRYKFTCCACYKIFDAKSGGGICYVNCPYCGEQNKINTGEHARYIEKVPPTAAEERANYPTDPIDSLVFIRDGDVSRNVKEAKKSSFQVGDDVILELRSKKYHSEELDLLPMMLPAKITKYELHGMSLFKGPHYELVFQPVTDVPCITVERKLQKTATRTGERTFDGGTILTPLSVFGFKSITRPSTRKHAAMRLRIITTVIMNRVVTPALFTRQRGVLDERVCYSYFPADL